jgi:hypothetical protein
MAKCGLMVEDLIEIQVPPATTNNDFPEFPHERVQRGPAEEPWLAHR